MVLGVAHQDRARRIAELHAASWMAPPSPRFAPRSDGRTCRETAVSWDTFYFWLENGASGVERCISSSSVANGTVPYMFTCDPSQVREKWILFA